MFRVLRPVPVAKLPLSNDTDIRSPHIYLPMQVEMLCKSLGTDLKEIKPSSQLKEKSPTKVGEIPHSTPQTWNPEPNTPNLKP